MRKPKSKRTKPTGPRFKWDIEEWADLLAWLDHCICSNRDFQATVVDHLTSKRSRDYTLTRVDNMLRSIWNYGHKYESKSRSDITKHGTACLDLPWMEREEREAISNAKEKLKDDIASSIAPIRSRNGTESVSIAIVSNSERHENTELAGSGSGQSRDPRSVSAFSVVIPSRPRASKRKASTVDDRTKFSLRKTKARRQHHFVEHNPESVPDSQEDQLDEVISPSPNDQDVNKPVEKQDPILLASPSTADILESKDEIRCQHQMEERDRQLASMESLNRNLHDKINRLHREVDLLSSKLETTEQKLRGYDECRRAAQREKDPIAKILEYELRATDSRQQLQEIRKLVKFTKSIADKPELPDTAYIEQSIDHIDNRSKVTIDSNEGPPPEISNDSELGTSSKQLLCEVFSIGMDLVSAEYVAAHVAKGIDLCKILRAMMAAAVQQWAFESDFPKFYTDDSRLMETYRKCLAMQEDGAVSVRNLDFVAHWMLVNEHGFKHNTIPRKAKELTIQLSQALAPFFPRTIHNTQLDGFEVWGQEEEAWIKRRNSCEDIFQYALELKARLLTSMATYKLIVFEPNTPFSPMTMSVEDNDGAAVNRVPDVSAKVKICLFPALLAFPREDGTLETDTAGNDLSRVLVQYDNFSQHVRTASEFKVITKAVVLLQD